MITDTTAPAFLTALHLAMAILRRHRSAGRSVLSPWIWLPFLFVLAPWVWPTAIGIAAGVAAHALWFGVSEWLAPPKPSVAPASKLTARHSAETAVPSASSGGPAFVSTTVVAVLDEARDIKTFRLARPAGFEFVAGQFLTVRLQIDGKPHVRCYSISSAPHTRGYLEISVRKQGLVSGTLHATVRAGSTLTIGRPAGQFVYPAGDARPLVLLAGGVGITPLLSMARHAVAEDPLRPVTLFYSVRTQQDLAFSNELGVLAERHPHLGIVVTLTQPLAPSPWLTGAIDAALIRRYVTAPEQTIFCLCGPPPMIESMRKILGGLGVPASQVRYERFDTAVAASQVQAGLVASPATRTPHGIVRVTFDTSHRTVSASSSSTLLETAEAEGIAITSSCRSGVCQSCRTRMTSGQADCRSAMLDADDRADGYVLPCVTWPVSDCVLEA